MPVGRRHGECRRSRHPGPLRIEQAVENLNRSMVLKKQGDLKSAAQSARQALALARQALVETREKRMQSVTAILSHKRGSVQYRPNDAIQWKDAILRQEFIENDRVRTLSRRTETSCSSTAAGCRWMKTP